MSKKDKQSMTEDYLAQVAWENDHPLDDRGHPSSKYQPQWKYKRVYGGTSHGIPGMVKGVWLFFVFATLGYIAYDLQVLHSGNGVFFGILALWLLSVPYFVAREPK